jgi:flavin-dependent dehydrogenase
MAQAAEVVDVLIVGGGPAGSSCARALVRGGARVAVVDRAAFPRVKLCGGWVSAPIWDALALAPGDYPGGLWEWTSCHVRYQGVDHSISCRGWFIRRFELDDFLLRTSGAELHLGTPAGDITRDGDGLWSVAGRRARHLVGAGGTHCPVARLLQPPRPMGPVGVQEHEFQADAAAVARTRIGRDGEPELLLHDDLGGYSWNVPKTDWLNVGSGTANPNEVRAAWQAARAHFFGAGHLPAEAAEALEPKAMKGYAYYLFDPAHLTAAARVDADGKGSATLCGDGLGLAQPLTAEGILPAVVSGRVCAEAILAGDPASYPARLAAHPVIDDYRRVFRLREAATGFVRPSPPSPPGDGGGAPRTRAGRLLSAPRVRGRAIATGFAWMFSGARLPAPRLIDLALTVGESWGRRHRQARAA